MKVTNEDGLVVEFKYNGDNLLTERKVGSEITRYYYDGAHIIAEANVDENGNISEIASYLYGAGLIMCDGAAEDRGYYLKNGHGDIVEIRGSNQWILNQYQYDLWGNTIYSNEQIENPFRFSGEYWDDTIKLQYLRARWYQPSLGRFINEDTYEGELDNQLTLNLYTYVHNNPLKYIDPSGHVAIGVDPEVWRVNGLINEQKIKWNNANNANDLAGMKAASAEAERLRKQYSHLSGLLQVSDPYQTVHQVDNSDETKSQEVRISQNGHVLYEKQSGYEYYVESHRTTRSDKAQAVAGRIIWDGAVGYTSSKVLKWAGLDKNKKLVDGAVTVGGAVIGDYIVDVYTSSPSVGEERHIIWRTDKKTGQISNLVVVTDGRKVIDDRYWYITKKGK